MWYMTEERILLQKAVKEFVQHEVVPFIPNMEKDEYPRDILRKMGQIGILGLAIDKKFGGSGVDWINFGLAIEEIAKESSTMALLTSLAADMTIGDHAEACTPEQIEKFIKPALRGDILLGAWSTEPSGATNRLEHKTTAVLDGDEWVINGGKIFATNAGVCDYAIVNCRTKKDVNPLTMDGWSGILIPTNIPGLTVGHHEHKLGWKGTSTCQVYFNNCRVPKGNLLGPLHKYQDATGSHFLQSYVLYGVNALGSAEGVFEKTKEFLTNRIQNGQSLWNTHQAIRYEMAQLWSKIELFRGAVYSILENRNNGDNVTAQAIAAKIEGAKLLELVSSKCITLHGGTGTIMETDIERYYRDAKMLSLGCGSNNSITDLLGMFI